MRSQVGHYADLSGSSVRPNPHVVTLSLGGMVIGALVAGEARPPQERLAMLHDAIGRQFP